MSFNPDSVLKNIDVLSSEPFGNLSKSTLTAWDNLNILCDQNDPKALEAKEKILSLTSKGSLVTQIVLKGAFDPNGIVSCPEFSFGEDFVDLHYELFKFNERAGDLYSRRVWQ